MPVLPRFFFYIIGAALLASALVGCGKSATPGATTPTQPVILTLGPKTFTADDFFQSYTKNQLADSVQRLDIKQYLDLYTNLKIKVLAAEQNGRDTTEAFREEIDTYRKQLAQSYLTDKVLVEQLAAEAYQRLQTELKVSHLLVAVPEDASPADTLRALQTALALRDRLAKGDDFATLARQYSADPTAARNGGDLGYFTAFSKLYPFETAAYQTPVGAVTQPVRTRSGYHLIQVTDRRPSRGRVRVAHILVRMSPQADEVGKAAAKARIDEVYAKLQRGESFETLARQYSDDTDSKNTGGVLPAFGVDKNVPPFEEAAFSLSVPGTYSTPFLTNYGWQIVRLIERLPLEPYAELATNLRQRVVSHLRADALRQATLRRLRPGYAIQENSDIRRAVLTKADSSLLRGTWSFQYAPTTSAPGTTTAGDGLLAKTLLTLNQKPITAGQFITYIRQKQQPRPAGSDPATVMLRLYDRFVGDQILAAEEAGLEAKYPEFKALMAEIRDGVLLSQEMEVNVWDRAVTDSLGQRQWYETNKARYSYPERAAATIITASDDATLKQAKDMLATRPYGLRRSSPELRFDKHQTVLTPGQRETLFETLVTMVKNQEYILEISGSRDETERDSSSAGRIRSVISYLRANGVGLNRIIEKNLQGFRPGATGADARRVTFLLFSNSKRDVERILNSSQPGTTPQNAVASAGQTAANRVTITDGLFVKGANPVVDAVPFQVGTTERSVNGQVVSVTISRIEPARGKTFAEARGTVINEYQANLEQQWLTGLKQKYPVQINETEMRKLVK